MTTPQKEWYRQQDIADMLGVHVNQVYQVVAALRRLNQIRTTKDPTDERVTLVHESALPAIRTALHKNGGEATA